MIATKEQERKALEKIRKIITDLGEQSYLATAFDGCFEDAETNIENDFAFSMKSRYEAEQEKSAHFKAAAEHYAAEAERMQKELKEQQDKLSYWMGKVPAADDLEDCLSLATEYKYDCDKAMRDAAALIVEAADDPYSEEFISAVAEHRKQKSTLENMNGLISRLQSCRLG